MTAGEWAILSGGLWGLSLVALSFATAGFMAWPLRFAALGGTAATLLVWAMS